MTPDPPAFRPDDVLAAARLSAAIDGARDRLRRHLAGLHGAFGLLDGLEARLSGDRVVVSPGAAIDAGGRLLALDRAAELPAPADGRWLLVLEAAEPGGRVRPRWAADDGSARPGRAIALARWRPGTGLDPSPRLAASRPGARAQARVLAGTAARGALPATPLDGPGAWLARLDTAPARPVGPVAYLVAPTTDARPAGAAWSLGEVHPDLVQFQAAGWPLPDPDTKRPKVPTALAWIGVEVGVDRPDPSRSRPMPDAPPADAPAPVPLARPQPDDPFALPPPPTFAPNQNLSAADLTGALGYLDRLRTLHNRLMHPWGVVAGLGVATEPGGDGRRVRVEPGLALDAEGRELVVEVPQALAPPPEALLAGGPPSWLLVAAAPAAPLDARARVGWRDPGARTGPRALRDGLDVVLARVGFEAGKVKGPIDPTGRRPARPSTGPGLLAGLADAAELAWTPWARPDASPGAPPGGVFARVPTAVSVAGRIILAQLVGPRFLGRRVLDGPTLVLNPGDGFDFVVAFPDPADPWGFGGRGGLDELTRQVREQLKWQVAWIAASPTG
jgi:hypothetical protein